MIFISYKLKKSANYSLKAVANLTQAYFHYDELVKSKDCLDVAIVKEDKILARTKVGDPKKHSPQNASFL